MNKKLFFFTLAILCVNLIHAQWNTNGTSIYYSSGYVGIGISNPASALHVYGNIIFQNDNVGIQFRDAANSNKFQMGLATSNGAYSRFAHPGDFVLGKVNSPGDLYISNQINGSIYFTQGSSQSTDNIVMAVVGNNVGIGTTNTYGYKLAVNGSAIFTKAVVKLYANWPDYVFERNYQLQPLDSLEAFIQANKHLPGIASANEIEKNGIDIGENERALLEKTEELTLYIISQNKTITTQASQITSLQNQLNYLQNIVKQLKEKIENK